MEGTRMDVTGVEETISDEELTALALAAHPDVDVATDAVPIDLAWVDGDSGRIPPAAGLVHAGADGGAPAAPRVAAGSGVRGRGLVRPHQRLRALQHLRRRRLRLNPGRPATPRPNPGPKRTARRHQRRAGPLRRRMVGLWPPPTLVAPRRSRERWRHFPPPFPPGLSHGRLRVHGNLRTHGRPGAHGNLLMCKG